MSSPDHLDVLRRSGERDNLVTSRVVSAYCKLPNDTTRCDRHPPIRWERLQVASPLSITATSPETFSSDELVGKLRGSYGLVANC